MQDDQSENNKNTFVIVSAAKQRDGRLAPPERDDDGTRTEEPEFWEQFSCFA